MALICTVPRRPRCHVREPESIRVEGCRHCGSISSTPTTLLISSGIPLVDLIESECGHPDAVETEAVADERRPSRRAALAVNESEECAGVYLPCSSSRTCPSRCSDEQHSSSMLQASMLVALSHLMPCKPWALRPVLGNRGVSALVGLVRSQLQMGGKVRYAHYEMHRRCNYGFCVG